MKPNPNQTPPPAPTQPLAPPVATVNVTTPAKRAIRKVPVDTTTPEPKGKTSVSNSGPNPPVVTINPSTASSQQVKKGGGMLWPLVVLIVGLAIAAAIFFKPSSGEKMTAGNGGPDPDVASVRRNMNEQEDMPGANEGSAEGKSISPRVNKTTSKSTQSIHFNNGGVIRRLGGEIRKDRGVFKLLYVDPNPASRKVFMQPTDRSIAEVAENLSFDGFRPPAGSLTVFDTVDDQVTGIRMNVYAWRLK